MANASLTPPLVPMRLSHLNSAPLRSDGRFVLYWMMGARRTRDNAALAYAADQARQARVPLVVLEPLFANYRWASDRFHRFVLDGMADQAAAIAPTTTRYYPYVEQTTGAGAGLLQALAAEARLVVTDRTPVPLAARYITDEAPQLGVRLDAVDTWGLLPLHATTQVFTTAHAFRRFLQQHLAPHLPFAQQMAALDIATVLNVPPVTPEVEAHLARVQQRWPVAEAELLAGRRALTDLPINHAIAPAPFRGGATAATETLQRFLWHGLPRYGEERSDPDANAASGLSPYLHFGHIGPGEVFTEVMARAGWDGTVTGLRNGARAGWWNVEPNTESFLDEFVTWREVGANMAVHRPDFDTYQSLPPWALRTLTEHAADARPITYDFDAFDQARTHDALWNAAQRELVEEGRMQNYLRMLWGKKILEWTRTSEEALAVMIELNNRYAVDGRDPSSYSGIFWVLGRYDRAWGPERPIYGTLRYMTSDSTRRKLSLTRYLARYGTR